MKQHDFDNWVKDGISNFEQSKKVQWNKEQVFEEMLAAQDIKKTTLFKSNYWIAALIFVLVTLNIFQFVRINTINETHLNTKQALANTINQNIELKQVLNDNQNTIENFNNKIKNLATTIELKDEQLKNLEQTLKKNISAKEIQFITKYVHDTIYIEQEAETNYLANAVDEIQEPEKKEVEKTDYNPFQYVSMYKPLISNKTNQKRETKIKISLGSDDSNVGQQKSESFNLLSTDL